MRKYKVIWLPSADDQLMVYWMAAKDRDAVAAAQYLIDKQLERDPRHLGQELSEGLWKIYLAPLLAFYEIDEPNGRVVVSDLSLAHWET
jgi:hypothetical protein